MGYNMWINRGSQSVKLLATPIQSNSLGLFMHMRYFWSATHLGMVLQVAAPIW